MNGSMIVPLLLFTIFQQAAINPNSQICEAAIYTNGLAINGNASYIVISNIQFENK